MASSKALETDRRAPTVLGDAALAGLAREFRGELILPGDTRYEGACRV